MKKQDLFAIYMAVFLVFSPKLVLAAVIPSSSSQPAQCSVSDLSFNIDDKNGYFNGMSQSGVLLVLRNIGSRACSVPARPILSFEDTKYRTLSISLQVPMGMHPGPVILPITIPVGARVTSQLHWISSDVYGNSNCISPAFISISIGERVLRAKFNGYLCGPAGKNPTYTLTLLKRDVT